MRHPIILATLLAALSSGAAAQVPVPTDMCAEQSQARFPLGNVRSGITEWRDSVQGWYVIPADSIRWRCVLRKPVVPPVTPPTVPPSPPPAPLPPPPPPPSSGGNAEPADPSTGYIWADNFDRYTTLLSMQQDQSCNGVGQNARDVYGLRTQPNANNGCIVGTQFQLTAGRSGTGQALRSLVSAGPNSVSWLSAWPQGNPGLPAYDSTRALVIQIWFRTSPGGTPGPSGTKFLEIWLRSSGNRLQWGADGSGPRWAAVLGANTGNTINRTQSSAAWTAYNDGQWHRATMVFRGNTSTSYRSTGGTSSATDVYTGTSSRNGRIALWLDGVLVLDYQQSKVGVSCTQSDVDFIPAWSFAGGYLKFPDVFNNSPIAWTMDHDDLKVWTSP